MNIENKKQIAIILLAIGLGLVAAVLTGSYIQKSIEGQTNKIAKEFEIKKVKPLMQEMAAMQKELKKLASQQVRVIQAPPKEQEKREPSVPRSSLALRTPAGKRAYTVRIDSLSAVGGLVNPGDYVDIISHLNMPDIETGKKTKISTIIYQNIQILAVGTNLQAPGGYEKQQAARSLDITMALSPEESSLMSFIEKNGKLQLILRAPAETEIEILQTASWQALADYVFEKQGTELSIPRPKASVKQITGPAPKEEVKPFIQIYQGGNLK